MTCPLSPKRWGGTQTPPGHASSCIFVLCMFSISTSVCHPPHHHSLPPQLKQTMEPKKSSPSGLSMPTDENTNTTKPILPTTVPRFTVLPAISPAPLCEGRFTTSKAGSLCSSLRVNSKVMVVSLTPLISSPLCRKQA